jgi:fatty acid-binding protein DegV
MLYMSAAGNLETVGKEKGRPNAMHRLVSYVEELGQDIEKHRIIIGHADVPELVERLKHMLIERFGENLRIETVLINPTVGCHSGPDTLGLSFHAIHR